MCVSSNRENLLRIGLARKCGHVAVFHKILGMRPAKSHNVYDQEAPSELLPLYGASGSREEAVNARCARLCRDDPVCYGYLLVFSQNVCYGYSSNRTAATTRYDYIDEANHQLVTDANVAFFVKTNCLDVPLKCATTKLFPLVSIPGAALIMPSSHHLLPRLVTRDECANACFREQRFPCRSARFVRSFRNNRHRLRWSKIDRAQMGQCYLSRADRFAHPEAFRRGWEDDEEYLENQCHAMGDRGSAGCSFEQHRDTAFVYADDSLIVSEEKSCSERCLNEDRFVCVGYTYHNASSGGGGGWPRCSLHSDDLTSLGPKAVRTVIDSVYAKRVACLKLAEQCLSNRMEVAFDPDEEYRGRMYLNTAHQNCSYEVVNNGTQLLEIATGNELVESRCGIRRAFIKGNMFDFLVFAYVYIQRHPVIRTQADRLLKMGCIHHFDSANVTQLMNNLPMQSTVDFIPHSQSFSIGSTEVRNGTSKVVKGVTTELIDVETQAEVFKATLGQLLEMRIKSSNPDFDMVPHSLQAYSGDQTLTLLDDKGCPLDGQLLSGFRKEKKASEIVLAARFHAFMFPSSTTINFRLTIQFCYESCPKAVCFYQ
ncbi:AAEL003278-PA [Aedes aegypti]|uniref:AAEL003278-PA n=1 Tax=Aedes aegypti TaxID=7159 RepID=Q17FY1_AEDAE|nr:AAEL003278-PA [Aedes aegypti]